MIHCLTYWNMFDLDDERLWSETLESLSEREVFSFKNKRFFGWGKRSTSANTRFFTKIKKIYNHYLLWNAENIYKPLILNNLMLIFFFLFIFRFFDMWYRYYQLQRWVQFLFLIYFGLNGSQVSDYCQRKKKIFLERFTSVLVFNLILKIRCQSRTNLITSI